MTRRVIDRAKRGPRLPGLISSDIINDLGPKGYLVNVARGSLINEDALIAALETGHLGGAALDVFCDEPADAGRWKCVPNVLSTPRIAGKTAEAIAKNGPTTPR
ncbi:NAD(P)-dependent oxidoreductase [Sphingomonas sp. PP-CE-1G-424]|uniref:NAD(P)-dependent oxidoreductase n=1 Tax=Sphingomonas sp. PP-CE-1G-424 TaxID=2135658 RepID=UPI001055E051|nr:NAD(P)-dependent oxidoreductase [Sphingomonas sp. PP-CE-1G-424]